MREVCRGEPSQAPRFCFAAVFRAVLLSEHNTRMTGMKNDGESAAPNLPVGLLRKKQDHS
jgi:hypothetical protein